MEGSDNFATAVLRRNRRGFASFGLEASSPERRNEYDKRLSAADLNFPPAPRATVQALANHIDYAVKLVGVDRVRISSGFDGGGGVDGWNSAAEAANVTLELVRRGYTEKKFGKLCSGNLLRVWGEVEKVSQKFRKIRLESCAILKLSNSALENDRLIKVSIHSYVHGQIHSVTEVSKSIMKQVEGSFVSYNKSRGKKFTVNVVNGLGKAVKRLQDAIQDYER